MSRGANREKHEDSVAYVCAIGADDFAEEALQTMTEHKLRRLPVIDAHEPIGLVSQADLAIALGDGPVSKLVKAISPSMATQKQKAAARGSRAR